MTSTHSFSSLYGQENDSSATFYLNVVGFTSKTDFPIRDRQGKILGVE